MNRLTRITAALAVGWSLSAGAAQLSFPTDVVGPYTLRVTSLKEARHLGTIQQQYDFSCGSAALATLLTHHYGYAVTEQVVFRVMYLRGDQAKIRREGFSLLDMKNFLAANGFASDGFEAPLEALTKAKVPAIALVSEMGYHHFVVIKGLQDGRVLIGDPARGTRAVSRSAFEAMWHNKILFVIKNHLEAARFNRAADWRVAPRAPLEAGLRGLPNAIPAMRAVSDF
ncbi:C39 family peptidase [Nitrogeniibacter mangrovi]|uniref:C39 family peptidase n=1 Tax=Nitrogeniibacter mangrovi TaxID=2016596 RepID=A0A6C1B3B6_9RHOO|nr:C39 family peptidase [Nitrogeniibacter mangrovi]QID16820.1 C39 family peptidase [Nitrogeniibacter mangrovi]